MIVVTGANGKLGGGIVSALVKRVPPGTVIASVRDATHPLADGDQGVAIRPGDFSSREALSAAFAGATQVLVVSVNQLGDPARRLHEAAIEAAYDAGARRVLYTSHMGARADSPFAPASDHAAAEAFLARLGNPFTALRHGFYAESALHMIGHGLKAGEVVVPENGPVSWTARADLAEADAILLADEGRLGGITPALTASEAFTMDELVALASEVMEKQIRLVTLTDAAWIDAMVAKGTPEPMAHMLLGSYQASRRGDFAEVNPTLAEVLGRAPTSMREVLLTNTGHA